jgi:hypothetical protein
MRKIFLLIFTLLLTSTTYSQTSIEVIRASSYYSNAITDYTNGHYTNALKKLQFAEKNLKGKTNRDLEYLKIMTNYHLKRYKQAYNLTTAYLKGDYFERRKSFSNVTSFSNLNAINYEEELTAIFVDIEEKSNSDEPIDIDNILEQIVTKVETKKIPFSSYIKTALLPKVTEKIDYCLREVSNGTTKRVYENNFLNLKMAPTNKKYSFDYTGTIRGKAINTSNYKVNITFSPTKAELNNNYYSYGYKQNTVKHLAGEITLNTTAYQCYSLTSPKRESSYFTNLLIKNFKSKSFTKKGYKTKTYKIFFTDKETNFLKQNSNLTKLNSALRSKGLL